MNATDQMRTLLDQLMGADRNATQKRERLTFDNPRVCRAFLVGCCPHDALSGTRYEIGPCTRVHELVLKDEYEKARASGNTQTATFELDALEELERFVAEADRKCEQAKRRLIETQAELGNEQRVQVEAIHIVNEELGSALARAEQLGAEGKVTESLSVMQTVEELSAKKKQLEREMREQAPASAAQQQKLRVCEICCSYLGVHDNDRRLADHFGGKLHLGFKKIRDTLAELRRAAPELRDRATRARNAGPAQPARSDTESRQREPPSRSRHDSDRSRERDRSRDERSRDRDRERQRKRSRSRSGSSSPRSSRGGRDRDRDDRKRERERERDRDRRSRSRDRSRERDRDRRRSDR